MEVPGSGQLPAWQILRPRATNNLKRGSAYREGCCRTGQSSSGQAGALPGFCTEKWWVKGDDTGLRRLSLALVASVLLSCFDSSLRCPKGPCAPLNFSWQQKKA